MLQICLSMFDFLINTKHLRLIDIAFTSKVNQRNVLPFFETLEQLQVKIIQNCTGFTEQQVEHCNDMRKDIFCFFYFIPKKVGLKNLF